MGMLQGDCTEYTVGFAEKLTWEFERRRLRWWRKTPLGPSVGKRLEIDLSVRN